mgnify:CR=1 FL=1
MRKSTAQHQFAAQARGAHAGTRGHVFEPLVLGAHERVTRIFSRAHSRQRKAFGQLHRNVLERVHGQIGAPFDHRRLEFLDEQALAADLRERLIENLIAPGGHPENLHVKFGVARTQQRLHVQGLPHRKRAFARGDHAAFQFGHGFRLKAIAAADGRPLGHKSA